MASEQQQRRENTKPEREVHIEKDKVPKMTTHFEAMTVHVTDTSAGRKDTPLDSGSKQSSKDEGDKAASMRSGNTVGDVGMEKARGTHGIGSHKLESLKDTQASAREDRQRESHADKARAENMVADKEAESKKESRQQGGPGVPQSERSHEAKSQGGGQAHGQRQGSGPQFEQGHETKSHGGVQGVAHSFEQRHEGKGQGGGQGQGQGGTRQSVGKVEERHEAQGRQTTGKVEGLQGGQGQAHGGRQGQSFGKVQERQGAHGGGQQQREGRGGDRGHQTVGKFEVSGEEEQGRTDKGRESSEPDKECRRTQIHEGVEKMTLTGEDKKLQLGQEEEQQGSKGRRGSESEMKSTQERSTTEEETKIIKEEEGRRQGTTQQQPSLEEISQLRATAQQNSMEAMRAAEERYAKAKESARQGLGSATEYASETAGQAKDTLLQGAQTAKETLTSAGKTAIEKTAPLAERAKDVAVSAGQTTLHYVEEGAVKAKDKTLEGGKTSAAYAADVAVDLKDKGTVAGWTAAHYTTEAAVEGTKKAAKVVIGAAEYAGHKAVDIVSKPLSVVKDATAVAGEKAEEYTARKKEEAQRVLEAKRSAEEQNKQQSLQGGEREGSEWEQGTTWNKQAHENVSVGIRGEGDRSSEKTQGYQGGHESQNRSQGLMRGADMSRDQCRDESWMKSRSGGAGAGSNEEYMMSMDSSQVGEPGEGVLGAVTETLLEIGQTTKDMLIGGQHGMEEEELSGGWMKSRSGGAGAGSNEEYMMSMDSSQVGEAGEVVLGAVTETLLEIGQTTKDMLIGGQHGMEEEELSGGQEQHWKSSTDERSKQGMTKRN
ncbi:unnamed protein product [Malus baccata var. baccata]